MISIHSAGPNLHPINHKQTLLDPSIRQNTPARPVPQAYGAILSSPSATFDSILATAKLPPPGPDYYVARRALWLTPRCPATPRSPEPSTSRKRLEKILSSPNAVESEAAWKNGIEDVWKGLSGGGRLKRRLPMSLIIKVTHAAWIRDQTWPMGAVAPEPDDILFDDETSATIAQTPSLQASMTEYSSGAGYPLGGYQRW
ncbi:hypothetical protein BDZ94DRAFT_1161945 [Collybia nuda]|uniref:Uncharacterized protein n=1 Tax=Collybia nuda TaxID=64659 RepID=A0A9P6CJI8_9AGAR|nr:hypothetical protein BDZ94DRAFT_1161945 [Collybia nuda]